MSDNMNRVFLWCVPRTVSTAFLKCISFVEGLQVVNEPYQCAFHAGPEGKRSKLNLSDPVDKRTAEVLDNVSVDEEVRGFDDKICTYGWIRDELLEASHPDKKILFCKDMAFYIDAKYHMLPKGFRHSFLIRHPAKVFPSWRKMLLKTLGEPCAKYMDNLQELPEYLFPPGCGFKEQCDLLEYVERHLDKEPIILDADDLLADPPGILSAYCHKMGIPYSPDLLSWEAGGAIADTWITSKVIAFANKLGGFYDDALQSVGFWSPEPPPVIQSLPVDVQACVEASMEYYEKLHSRRIKPLSQ
ncbi:branched-chain-amino-acid aminotransferase-like protein 2 [Acanthaster planci]|uniref:Branched-chain-amino-acid aminotransferase-like protein 2 n=1 Tax=Acanthaster planci TaxID=133434 RepID=A0A8B7XU48_ACAPL|nr:branched-chain-amino-acid aminotransferase-like protein 2 [Acanthaster planci]